MADGDKKTQNPVEQTKNGSGGDSDGDSSTDESRTQEAKQQVASEYDAYDASDLMVSDGQVQPKREAVERERQETKQAFAQRFEEQFTTSSREQAREQFRQTARSGNVTPETIGDITKAMVTDRPALDVGFGPGDVSLVRTDDGTSARLSESGQREVKEAQQKTLAEQLSEQADAEFTAADVTPTGQLTGSGESKLERAFASDTPGVDRSGVDVKQTDSGFQTVFTDKGEQQYEQFAAERIEGVGPGGIDLQREGGAYVPTLTGKGKTSLEQTAAQRLEQRLEGRSQEQQQERRQEAIDAGINPRMAERISDQGGSGLAVNLTGGDVELDTSGDNADFDLTQSGEQKIESARKERIASQFDRQVPVDVDPSDITTRRETPATQTGPSSEGAGETTYTLNQETRKAIEDYQREQAEGEVEKSLEEQTGADLQDEDVYVEETTTDDGETAYTGGLTDKGEQEVAGQNVPGSDLPVIGGALEGGGESVAKLDQAVFEPTSEYVGSRVPQYDVPTPEGGIPSLDDLIDKGPLGDGGGKKAAIGLAGAFVATPEPVTTGIGTGTLAAIGAATVVGGGIGAAKSSYFEGPPEANAAYQGSEIGIPQQQRDSGELPVTEPTQEQSEIALTGGDPVTATEIGLPTGGVFDSELSPTDGQQGGEIPVGTGGGETPILASMDAVVGGTVGEEDTGPQTPTTPGEGTVSPEQPGVGEGTVEEGTVGDGTSEEPVEDTTPTDVTEETDQTEPTDQTDRTDETDVGDQFNETPDDIGRDIERSERTFDRSRSDVGSEDVDFGEIDRSVFNQNQSRVEPDFGEVTKPFYEQERGQISEGDATGPSVDPSGPASLSSGSAAGPRTRQATRPSLDVNVADPAIERLERAQGGTVGDVGVDPFESARSNPGVRPETSPLQDVDTAVKSLTQADTRAQSTADDIVLTDIQAQSSAEGIQFESPQSEANADVNQYESQYDFKPRRPRRPRLPDIDLESDTGKDKRKGTSDDSGIFDNPAVDPTSAFTFDPFKD